MINQLLQLGEFGMGLYGIGEQIKLTEEARTENKKRWETMVGMNRDLRGRVQPNIERLGKEQMQMLEGSGRQEKKDIQRQWSDRRQRMHSNLNRRGLGNTTVGASMEKGYGEFEGDELGRLQERLRGEKMQTHGYWGLLGNQVDTDLTGQAISIQGQRVDTPGTSPALAYSQFLGSFVKGPEPPEDPGTDWAALGVQTATGVGMGLIASDPALKGEITDVDHETTLERVDMLDVKEWRYKAGVGGPGGKHMGPMADQFKGLFELGDSDKTINMLDAVGVCLSAIKALSARVRELEGS